MKNFCARLVLAAILLPWNLWSAELRLTGVDLGAASMFSYNSAWSQTTATDLRLGFGLGTRVNFSLGRDALSLMFNFTKSQLLSQRIDGSKNSTVCSEDYFPAIFQIPGPCSLIQVRLSPIYWIHNFGLGISIVYNYFSDFTFHGAQIYNTKRSYEALGPVIAYQKSWGRFTLIAAAHFDYAVLSQTPLVTDSVKSLQTGVTLYALYAVY